MYNKLLTSAFDTNVGSSIKHIRIPLFEVLSLHFQRDPLSQSVKTFFHQSLADGCEYINSKNKGNLNVPHKIIQCIS